jgi:hypothetical protein
MGDWSKFSDSEIERRRLSSVAAVKRRDAEAWKAHYQKLCDMAYWRFGQCCAGCDYWLSDTGFSGQCSAAGIVSGKDVLASMGITFSTYTPPPGFPFSEAGFHCGKFQDDFDWSELPPSYLEAIGAMRDGKLREKASHACPSPDLVQEMREYD